MKWNRALDINRWNIPKRSRWRPWEQLTPPEFFVGSFVVLIALGTIGFKTIPGLYTKESLSWLEALFTSTSAVCVTGLTVANTAKVFTPLGQAYLLLLIQLGGLGMIAFTSLIIVAIGRRLSLYQESLSTTMLRAAPHVESKRLIFDVVRFTLTFEAIGALVLYLSWLPRLGWQSATWHALFHSVSAFCNAGFSTMPDSLVSMRDSPVGLCVIMALIVLGGMGFLTLEETALYFRAWRKKEIFRMSLHSRLVVGTSLLLLVVGWCIFLPAEWNVTLKRLPFIDKLVNGLFLSVTPRTAGFNTIDYSEATETTCFLTILLMVIGGSPGSTAGGIKTTSFALLGIVAWSRLRGNKSTIIWNRSIREETTNRTVGLVVVALAIVMAGIFILTLTEYNLEGKRYFLQHSFEIVSAFNTVGLSMNRTGEISSSGRMVLICLMFMGRVGPLTFASLLAYRHARAGKFRFAYEDVIVG